MSDHIEPTWRDRRIAEVEPFTRPVGPQLTEYTGCRIATALERIADALERGQPATYPLGDPAPLRSSGEVEALVSGIVETMAGMQPHTLRVQLPESFTVTDRPIPGGTANKDT